MFGVSPAALLSNLDRSSGASQFKSFKDCLGTDPNDSDDPGDPGFWSRGMPRDHHFTYARVVEQISVFHHMFRNTMEYTVTILSYFFSQGHHE
jgi:hypothetical protein